jgi:hypothetical protein
MYYRHVTATERGFVQQLAVAYVHHGYWYYVTGNIPANKDPTKVDAKLLERYEVAISKWARARRKLQGKANVQYLRHGHFFVIIATQGTHKFFEEEGTNVKDIRWQPIYFAGYSISYHMGVDRKWHACVRIHPVEYNGLKSFYLDLATQSSMEPMLRELAKIPFEPYAAVRRQLLNILRAVNRARKRAGFELVPPTALRLHRRIVKPFATAEEEKLRTLKPMKGVVQVGSNCELSLRAFAAGVGQDAPEFHSADGSRKQKS